MDRLEFLVCGKSGGILFNCCCDREMKGISVEPMRTSSMDGRWTCEWQTCEDGGSLFIRNV